MTDPVMLNARTNGSFRGVGGERVIRAGSSQAMG